jgi:RNA polymerase sigma factor (sigma-70 family)
MEGSLVSKADDPIALLYREEGDRLWRAVFAFARDRDLASDAVAEAFAQCIRRGDAVRSPRDWVWKAAFRIAAGELQERGRWRSLSAEGASAVELPGSSARLVEALAGLSPHQRAAFLLRHVGGYDAAGIGDVLGCSPSTARVHVFRAKRKLREHLEALDDRS